MNRPSARRAARGQSLVLLSVMMLVIILAVFLTFSIGYRTREKIKLQAVADASAYSAAVVEARAFNFYAWSNRAIVAHMMSLLSVHAHQSYLTWYEDMLQGTVRAYMKMREELANGTQCGGCSGTAKDAAKDKLKQIAEMYLESGRDNIGNFKSPCYWTNSCLDDIEERVNFARGARWFHHQWEDKDNNNFCLALVQATRDHFARVQGLRAHQLNVERQLTYMLQGEMGSYDGSPFTGRTPIDTGFPTSFYERPRPQPADEYTLEAPISGRSVQEALARSVDPNIAVSPSGQNVNVRYYQAAVNNGLGQGDWPREDYGEVMDASRYPEWLTIRGGFADDDNWHKLHNKAQALAGNDTTTAEAWNAGNTRAIRRDWSDPGSFNNLRRAGNTELPGALPHDVNDYVTDSPWFYEVPQTGAVLVDDVNKPNIGGTMGIGAEDYGKVTTTYRLASCGCTVNWHVDQFEGRSGIWADFHDWDQPANTASNAPGVHSTHIFHGFPSHVLGHELGADDSLGRGTYRGHMRFKLKDSGLWNLPRTFALVTRNPQTRRFPWDFNLTGNLPLPVAFSTLDSKGDKVGGDPNGAHMDMAAMAGGLVYYHQPENGGGAGWRAPPNFWNPFWRAKLHPLKLRDGANVSQDAMDALRNEHRSTSDALNGIEGRAVNY